MRKALSFLLIIFVLLTLCACGRTDVGGSKVRVHFVYGDKDIHTTLTEEEAAEVTEILDGRRYWGSLAGIPACMFHEDVCITVDGHSYALALDDCNNLQDLSNLKYFSVSEKDMEYLRSLFEKYGGHFH